MSIGLFKNFNVWNVWVMGQRRCMADLTTNSAATAATGGASAANTAAGAGGAATGARAATTAASNGHHSRAGIWQRAAATPAAPYI